MSKLSVNELLCIFDLLEDDDDLRSLCRCCKMLNHLIQPRLFYRVELVGCRDRRQKSISFAAFRHILERSPHLVHYPREVKITLGIWDTEDMMLVLAALTGKNISFISLTGHLGGWESTAVKSAVEKFFRDSIIALDIILTSVQGISASCLHLTRHLLLLDSYLCGVLGPCTTKTISMTGFHGSVSLLALVGNVLPCLTHLVLVWNPPSETPGEWYTELGMALSNLPKLVLLTVHYYGKNYDFSCLRTHTNWGVSRRLYPQGASGSVRV